MTPVAADPRVDAWIRGQPRGVQAICRSARDLLGEGLAGAREDIKWGYPTWVGNGNVAAIAVDAGTDYVRLQFFRGVRLADPGGLLEGTGKEMRHVKVRQAKDLRTPQVKALVRSAWRVDKDGVR
jgi:hypothetical protein